MGWRPLATPHTALEKPRLISLTKAIALEYGRYNIRANIVCPGTVNTPLWNERASRNPEILAQLARWYPLGRIVEPIEVIRAVAFLASDAASAITGVVLPVDCGLTAGNIIMARELTLEDFSEASHLQPRPQVSVPTRRESPLGRDRDSESARFSHLKCPAPPRSVMRLRVQSDSRLLRVRRELIDVLRRADEEPHADALLTPAALLPVVLAKID
jgi:hypothetical protein